MRMLPSQSHPDPAGRTSVPSLVRILLLAAAIVDGAVLAESVALAGGPPPNTRKRHLLSCDAGANRGKTCQAGSEATDCPGGKCVMAFVPGGRFEGTLTIAVDDEASKYDGSASVTNVIAATVILDLSLGGKHDVFTQTYLNLEGSDFTDLSNGLQAGPFLGDTELSSSRTTELAVDEAAAAAGSTCAVRTGLCRDLRFQIGDPDLASEMRNAFNITGTPVITRILAVERFPRVGGNLGSMVRIQIEGRFATPPSVGSASCTQNSECPLGAPACDPNFNFCYDPGGSCLTDAACAPGQTCSGGLCVGCINTSFYCPPGLLCLAVDSGVCFNPL